MNTLTFFMSAIFIFYTSPSLRSHKKDFEDLDDFLSSKEAHTHRTPRKRERSPELPNKKTAHSTKKTKENQEEETISKNSLLLSKQRSILQRLINDKRNLLASQENSDLKKNKMKILSLVSLNDYVDRKMLRAQMAIAVLLWKKDFEEHKEEIIKLFRNTAKQGDARAQYDLGFILHEDAPQANKEEVTRLLRKSSEQGYEKAQQALDKIEI
ncbi:MAG TPA: hypothetical protein DD412_03680 [Holosporales bacterium]|nr:hypothetical protein [Holosporales bacterium]